MSWTNILLFVLLSSAWCLSSLSSSEVPDPANVMQSNNKHGTEQSSPSASIRSNIKEPASIRSNIKEPASIRSNIKEPTSIRSNIKEPASIRSNIKEPASIRSNIKEPTRMMVDEQKFAQTKQLDNQQKSVEKQPKKARYRLLEYLMPVSTHLSNNHDTDLIRISNNDHVTEMSEPLDSKYPETEYSNINGDQNGAFSDDTDQLFDDERDFEHASLDVSELNVEKSHGDIFPCLPCNCSYTAGRFVIANCTKRELYTFPLTLPSKTMVLNMSLNKLRTLNASSFLHYPDLLNVTLTSNTRLTEIRNGSFGNQTSKVRLLDLTACAIKTIQDDSFHLMPELINLTIRHNKLTHLTKFAFKGLGKLKLLDLSRNEIIFIEVGTFDDLKKLLSLDLSGNKRLGYDGKKFSPALFTKLKRLQKLSIHDNSDGNEKSYPNLTLVELVELRELSIDGLGNQVEFGPEMKSLKKLVTLKICGNCKIRNITEGFFENIPYLTSFLMDTCLNLAHVHPKAYSQLKSLQALSIYTMRNYKLDDAFKDLTGLNNSQLNSISFIHLRRPDYQCRYLGHENAQYLHNFKLVYLDLSHNSITLMGTDFLNELPKTLKTFIVKRNKFTSGTQSMKDLSVLTGLRELDLSMQNVDDFYDKRYSSLDKASEYICPEAQFKNTNDTSVSQALGRHIGLAPHDPATLEEQDDLTSSTDYNEPSVMCPSNDDFTIPPNLRILRASKYNSFGMQVLTHTLPENNSLSVIHFSNSFLSNWGTGKLPPGITEANLGFNYCAGISRYFFQGNNSHNKIHLNNNFLGPDFAKDISGQIFKHLTKTSYLDISTNQIYKISKPFFSGLSNLKYLKMSDNRLSILNASFAHMNRLQYIDLSRNAISWIDEETRNDLDNIAASSKNGLKIDLTMNPLRCTCDGFELISWMATTKVHFENSNLLTCYSDNSVSEPIGDLEKRRQHLQRLCMSKSVFIIGCVSALAVVMVIVTFGLMYRYRWKLRYLHNTSMAALFGFKPDASPKSGCTFDAYFVYTTETRDFVLDTCLKELEMKRGHRLCVEDRDFLAGTYIVSNIVSAVRNSTKTVVVMEPEMFEEPYFEYSFKMAVMEELYKVRSVLHVLVYELVPSDEMSFDLLKVMKRNSYIEFPPDEGADDNVRQKFWDELSQTIGHSGSDINDPVLEIE